MHVAELVRQARTLAGLSLRALAGRADTSHSALAAYEQGRKVPRLDTIERIVGAAGFVLDTSLRARPGHGDPERARALEDVLELADAFPFERRGPLTFPVFGRQEETA